MTEPRSVNTRFSTNKLRCDYAHVGLYDVSQHELWIARKKWGVVPVRVSHARLLTGGSGDESTADKDRFLCFWYHTPDTGEGYVHGYPIEWSEAHLLVRLVPNWNYVTQQFIPSQDTAKIEWNIEQQYTWGKKIFKTYVGMEPKFPLSWHMIGPRPADSMFYVERYEP